MQYVYLEPRHRTINLELYETTTLTRQLHFRTRIENRNVIEIDKREIEGIGWKVDEIYSIEIWYIVG